MNKYFGAWLRILYMHFILNFLHKFAHINIWFKLSVSLYNFVISILNCSDPGCKGNYTPESSVPVFKFQKAHLTYDTLGYVYSIVTIFLNSDGVCVC